MSLALRGAILFAKDVPKLAAFYRDAFGLTPEPSEHPPDEWMPLKIGDSQLALHRIPPPWRDGIEIGDPPEPRHSTPIKLVFQTEDVAKLRGELVARGVRMFDLAANGERCDGVDPEGNIFQLTSR